MLRTQLGLCLTLLILGGAGVSAEARPRGPRAPRWPSSPSKPKEELPPEPQPPVSGTEEALSAAVPEVADDEELTPARALANMLLFEATQGIQDYSVEVVEATTDVRTDAEGVVRKEIFFRAPATTLTMVDAEPTTIVDINLFGRFLDGVELAFAPEEDVDGVPCYVIQTTPLEAAFKDNIKFYYVAQDDFRKIRIRAVKTDSNLEKFWFINDFSYKDVDYKYRLPGGSRASLENWNGILLSETKATFLEYQINTGLPEEFFAQFLKDKRFNDTFKD